MGRPCGPAGRAAQRPSPTIAVRQGVFVSSPVTGIRGHDGGQPPGVVALEANQRAIDRLAGHADRRRPDGDRLREIDARRMHALRGAGRDDAGQVAAGADRLDLGRAGGDDDLAGVDVQHALGRAGHDRRARVDGHDLVAILGVEEQDVAPGRLRLRDGPLTRRSAADDDELDLPALDGDLGTERRPRRIRAVDDRQRGQPVEPDGARRPDPAAPATWQVRT